MHSVLERIQKLGIVPVIKIDRIEDTLPLAKALVEGGLPCAEVTFRTKAAKEAIRLMADAYPEMLIGAGTVLTKAQVDDAIEAGATFIVSPGINPEIVAYCIEKNIPIVPGCSSPTNIEQALALGVDTVKFFPAEAAGGLSMIKAMAAPYTQVNFIPTGGINEKNLNSYLDFPKILACGGSWMVNNALIDAGDFEGIKTLTQKAINTMLGFEIGHVGIYYDAATEADQDANRLLDLFGFDKVEKTASIFAGAGFELMKSAGAFKGHVAVKTHYMDRAMYYLEQRGASFDRSTAAYDDKGAIKAIYLKETMGGFGLHLLQA